jgi:hypothetical protein
MEDAEKMRYPAEETAAKHGALYRDHQDWVESLARAAEMKADGVTVSR